MRAAEDVDVAVIGAGHNGPAATALLAKRGLRVLCLEKNDYVGGMAGTREILSRSLPVRRCVPPRARRDISPRIRRRLRSGRGARSQSTCARARRGLRAAVECSLAVPTWVPR